LSHPDPDSVATTALKEKVIGFGYTEDYDGPFYNLDVYPQALESLIAEYPDEPVYKQLLDEFALRDA
jgi:hypothetical protein